MNVMECNKDEAVRARDLAEKKYAMQDFVGAKKFVLKAQQLFPSLEGLSQMLAVMEVHSVAQVKLPSGEMDWYGLLQVEPAADENVIKKQYRKLALLLHPDKNKAVGAEAAFKLIGEAFAILSDKTKRQLHDMRRGFKMKVVAPTSVPPADPSAHFASPFHVTPGGGPGPAPAPASTFWTSCPRCKMQYQYLRTYENYQLQCHKCKELFKACDIKAGYAWAPYQQQPPRQDFNFAKMSAGFSATNGFMNGAFQNAFPPKQPVPPAASAGVFPQQFTPAAAAAAAAASKVAAAAAAAAAATPVPTSDVVNQAYQKAKRDRMEAEKETKRKEKEQRKKENEERRKEIKKQAMEKEAKKKKEAMEKLVSKMREREVKTDGKRKMETRPLRRLKRRRRDEEEDDDEEEEDFKLVDETDEREDPPQEIPRRRSARQKKNVSTYKVDNSDSEMEDFPVSKKAKSSDEADTDDSEEDMSEDKGGKRAVPGQTENGVEKRKSVGHDGRWSGGMNAGEVSRTDVEAEVKEANVGGVEPKASNGAASVQNNCPKNQERVDATMRQEDVVGDSNGVESVVKPKLRPSRGTSKAEFSPVPDEKGRFSSAAGHETHGDVKLEENFCRSPSAAHRTRSQSAETPSRKAPVSPTPREEVQENSVSLFADEEVRIDVPDPDFHDFDSRRTENDIKPGQVWAMYDDQDGMPRFYARVTRVVLSPFKVTLHWLEPTPSTGQNKKWLEGTDLVISCGEFRIGKPDTIDQINIFSHLVIDKPGKGSVKIVPKHGEVWAVYKDWDQGPTPGPKRITKANGEGYSFSYIMVEVMTDYTEEKGCKVVTLTKVKGFKTLFKKVEGAGAQKQFRPSDLPQFSHLVVSERLFADDALGIPVGALELDPAATPLDLIMGAAERVIEWMLFLPKHCSSKQFPP
ncbi:hypothetical protein R1sor_018594 [Riccia sorocarpa]|uniref:J domain-containing protein n=1 Tax=Riccia sorocarpa TaxID=122646 RepID=A0ABD3IE92_9MARC